MDGKRNEVERYVISISCTVKRKGDEASKEKEKRVAFTAIPIGNFGKGSSFEKRVGVA